VSYSTRLPLPNPPIAPCGPYAAETPQKVLISTIVLKGMLEVPAENSDPDISTIKGQNLSNTVILRQSFDRARRIPAFCAWCQRLTSETQQLSRRGRARTYLYLTTFNLYKITGKRITACRWMRCKFLVRGQLTVRSVLVNRGVVVLPAIDRSLLLVVRDPNAHRTPAGLTEGVRGNEFDHVDSTVSEP